jgi:hypothetical protein
MFFSEVVKALQWVTLKGLRDELDRRHPAWAADQADLDDALAGANFLSAGEGAYGHPLFAQEPLRRPSDPAKRRWTR